MSTCVPNMKFLCLALWQGKVCTDANNDDARLTKHDCIGSLVNKPDEPKGTKIGTNYELHVRMTKYSKTPLERPPLFTSTLR